MDRASVQDWLIRYVEAWRANAPGSSKPCSPTTPCTATAPTASTTPRWASPQSWSHGWRSGDDPDSWDADYRVFAVDGERAVAVGSSRYEASGDEPARTFHNCFLLSFAADGRCAEFTDFYMEEPSPTTGG